MFLVALLHAVQSVCTAVWTCIAAVLLCMAGQDLWHYQGNAVNKCIAFPLQSCSGLQEPTLNPGASAEGAGEAAAAAATGPLGMASMVEEFLADSFLHQLFAKFFGMLYEEAAVVHKQLQTVSKQMQQLLEQRLGWDFDIQGLGQDHNEDDEYAPVVVQLDGITL